MKKKRSRNYFIVSVFLVFCILGGFVFSVVRSISREMSESAILSLGESLELMKGTIETLYKIGRASCRERVYREV